MSGLPTLPNTGVTPPNKSVRALFIVLGVTGLALSIYFGVSYLRTSKGTETSGNQPGQTTTTSGPTAPLPAPTGTPGATTGTTSVCTNTEKGILETDVAFNTWKSEQTTWISSTQAGLTGTPDATVASVPQLSTRQTQIQKVKACLGELNSAVQAASTTQSSLNSDIEMKKRTIEERKADIEIARDRATLAANPDYNRSYYDGWFPLDRPLRQQTIPILIGFALFFLSMSFLSILSFMRLDIRLLIPQFSGSGAATPLGSQARQPLFLGAMAVLAAVTGLMIWAFVRNK